MDDVDVSLYIFSLDSINEINMVRVNIDILKKKMPKIANCYDD